MGYRDSENTKLAIYLYCFYELICYSRFHGFKFRYVFRNILVAILRNLGLSTSREEYVRVESKNFRKYKLEELKILP